jgi:hypothetical protein
MPQKSESLTRFKFCLFLLLLLGCGKEQTSPETTDFSSKVEVIWTWKRTVNNASNFVYGTVRNKTAQKLKSVELEFRTQDAQGNSFQTHLFNVEDIGPEASKPFSKDYPATPAVEDSGFVTLKNVVSAD